MGVGLIQSNVSNFAFNMFDGMVWIATVLGLAVWFQTNRRHKMNMSIRRAATWPWKCANIDGDMTSNLKFPLFEHDQFFTI